MIIDSISITEMQMTNGINSQLSVTHSDRQDSGVYKCVAENPFGRSEFIIFVAVQGNCNIHIYNHITFRSNKPNTVVTMESVVDFEYWLFQMYALQVEQLKLVQS